MSVCDPDAGMHTSLRTYLPAQIFAELPRTAQQLVAFDSLLAAHAQEIAAVIVEPLVQGAGGGASTHPRSWPRSRQRRNATACC